DPMRWRQLISICALIAIQSMFADSASAMPAFARQYNITCAACHDAFPRLNPFGEQFAAMNYRLPQWRDTMMDLGDPRLALPKSLPLAIRAQAFVQGRDEGANIDVLTGATTADSSFDFQTP